MTRPRFLIGYSACPLTRAAFERAGVEAWTCDLLPARDGSERHLQCDVWEVARDRWDGALFHPMCTYLTVSAAWAFNDPDFNRYPGIGYHQRVKPGTLTGAARREARDEAVENFERLLALPYPKAIENPGASFISKRIRPADQLIQPNQFGDDASKLTGLWLDRMPNLNPTRRVPGRIVNGKERWANQTDSGQNCISPSEDRWLQRSETYPGIAAAMGGQWGAWLLQGRPSPAPIAMDDEDRAVNLLDNVERALKTKGIWGRHFALNAIRDALSCSCPLRAGRECRDAEVGVGL